MFYFFEEYRNIVHALMVVLTQSPKLRLPSLNSQDQWVEGGRSVWFRASCQDQPLYLEGQGAFESRLIRPIGPNPKP